MISQANIVKLGWVISALVIGYGFYIIGTPQDNRKKLEDRTQVVLLGKIDCAITRYNYVNNKLPETLVVLADSIENISRRELGTDCGWCMLPNKEEVEEFIVKNPTYEGNSVMYKLCATFHFADKGDADKLSYNRVEEKIFTGYKQGENCFKPIIRQCKNKSNK